MFRLDIQKSFMDREWRLWLPGGVGTGVVTPHHGLWTNNKYPIRLTVDERDTQKSWVLAPCLVAYDIVRQNPSS